MALSYKIEELPKGRIKIFGVAITDNLKTDVTVRPLTWDDRALMVKAQPDDKIKLCQFYARVIEEWTLDQPVMATTLLQDEYVNLCNVVDALIRQKFLAPIEFFTQPKLEPV